MKHRPYSFFALFIILLLVPFVGCKKDKKLDNLSVPRLMIETRGTSYGSLGGDVLTLPVSGTSIPVQRNPIVNEFEIANVEMVKVDMGLALLVQTTEKGARDLYRGSVSNMGSRVVLTVNGNPIGARRIDSAIEGGSLYTFVEVPDDDLPELVLNIKETIVELQTNLKK